jgi:hypothetical protein
MGAPRVRALAVVLFAVVVGPAVAACGGDDVVRTDNRYVREVNRAQTEFADRFRRLSTRITPTSTPRQDRRTLNRFQAAVEAVVRRLRAVRPPARVRALHRRLIAQIGGYGDQIVAARRAFASRDPRRVLAAQGRLIAAVKATGARINRTVDQINARLRTG